MLQISRHAELHHRMHLLGRADGRAGAQRREIALRPVGMLGERQRHVGRAVEDRAALALDQRQRLARLEALLQHHAAAVRHHVEQRVLAAEPPEERHGQPQPVALASRAGARRCSTCSRSARSAGAARPSASRSSRRCRGCRRRPSGRPPRCAASIAASVDIAAAREASRRTRSQSR